MNNADCGIDFSVSTYIELIRDHFFHKATHASEVTKVNSVCKFSRHSSGHLLSEVKSLCFKLSFCAYVQSLLSSRSGLKLIVLFLFRWRRVERVD